MKKTVFLFLITGSIIACNSSDTANGKQATGDTMQSTAASDPEIEKGLNLIAQSDCLGCHKVAEPLVGPSYEAVALKYKDTDEMITFLSQKIIKGGSGNWGTVPMAAHPTISEADAKSMAKYILSIK
jgi:cytochrome c